MNCRKCGEEILFPEWVFTHKTIYTQSQEDRDKSTAHCTYATQTVLVPDKIIPICPMCRTPLYHSSGTRAI